jgi:hypothetical protein
MRGHDMHKAMAQSASPESISARRALAFCHPGMMRKSEKRFSGDIVFYPFDLETDSDFRSIRPEIIRL